MRRDLMLPVDPSAPMRARHALSEVVPPPEFGTRFDDIRLAVSELVANAVRHAQLETGRDEIHLSFDRDDDHVRVEVEQPTSAATVAPRRADETGGYGLPLVGKLADAWGTQPGPPGMVWFDFKI